MKFIFVTILFAITSGQLYSFVDSTAFEPEPYAAEIDIKYQDALSLKSSYMKKNLFENIEDNYSITIDVYFDGDYIGFVESHEDDNGSISEEEFFFIEGKMVLSIFKKKSTEDEDYSYYKCYFLDQMMVYMIDDKEEKYYNDSKEFKKAQERVSWRISEMMDLLYGE